MGVRIIGTLEEGSWTWAVLNDRSKRVIYRSYTDVSEVACSASSFVGETKRVVTVVLT